MAEMAPPTSQIPMDKHSPCQFKIAMAKSPRKKKKNGKSSNYSRAIFLQCLTNYQMVIVATCCNSWFTSRVFHSDYMVIISNFRLQELG